VIWSPMFKVAEAGATVTDLTLAAGVAAGPASVTLSPQAAATKAVTATRRVERRLFMKPPMSDFQHRLETANTPTARSCKRDYGPISRNMATAAQSGNPQDGSCRAVLRSVISSLVTHPQPRAVILRVLQKSVKHGIPVPGYPLGKRRTGRSGVTSPLPWPLRRLPSGQRPAAKELPMMRGQPEASQPLYMYGGPVPGVPLPPIAGVPAP
jgi:hypothetical protein